MTDHETKKGAAGEAKRAPATPPLEAPPDRLDPDELDRRDEAKSRKRRPPGPPMDEEPPDDSKVPDVPPVQVEEEK